MCEVSGVSTSLNYIYAGKTSSGTLYVSPQAPVDPLAKYRPHVHAVTIKREYPSIAEGPLVITYGDQAKKIRYRDLGERHQKMVNRIVQRLVRRHDRETAKAFIRGEYGGITTIINKANEAAREVSVAQVGK